MVFPGCDADFDRLVHDGTLPDSGDLQVASKNHAPRDGNAAVVLAFTVELEDGSPQRVQTVTTLAALKLAVDCCVAAAERGV